MNPKVFVSHASEDKKRFVIAFKASSDVDGVGIRAQFLNAP